MRLKLHETSIVCFFASNTPPMLRGPWSLYSFMVSPLKLTLLFSIAYRKEKVELINTYPLPQPLI
jgi:hypothetical protein